MTANTGLVFRYIVVKHTDTLDRSMQGVSAVSCNGIRRRKKLYGHNFT